MSLDIQIKTIKHSAQRYETCGDWFLNPRTQQLLITVSELGDRKQEFLVALHELIECFLCEERGIKQEDVDSFDMIYESVRHPSDLVSEPGDDPRAPYHREHFSATTIERQMSELLGVNWKEYEDAIYALHQV